MHTPTLVSLTLTLGLGVSASAQNTTHVQLILDASGSMLGKLPDGQTRIASAKSTLTQFLGGVKADPSLNVGMRIYGGGLKAGPQCEDSVLVTPMKGFDKAALQAQVTAATPKGATPIVYSLMQAAADFPRDSSRKVIVLVTDGEESCGGKLTDAVAAFKKLGIEVDLRIIGIDLNDKARKSFEGVGTFENTRSGVELGQALGRATATSQTGKYAVSGPTSAGAGGVVEIRWTGPNNPGDYVTIVKKGAPIGNYKDYFYTKAGNPGKLTVPLDPGEYELRYSSEKANPNPTLASAPITLTPATYGLSASKSAGAGSVVEVKWTGPNNPGDYVTIVKKGTPVGQYKDYFYTRNGNPGKLTVPLDPGEYELRYSSEKASPNPTLLSIPITLTAVQYGLTAPASARPGSTIQVKWTGPNNPGDYVTVVKKGAPVGGYLDYFYTRNGNPGTLKMPTEAGSYELRYSSEKANPNPTLSSVPIEVR
ncbi:vWA domain-containing protein [Deinococcus arenicola]|uniref:VWA domain-containing protein n=1 Tax=Deinococcus arenicola TaxID=2994950 RepID=A0ABU4DT62_9DEIO|nr:VWA domain-containing protein [Deinococcus sp. ZS9-10]MDV6375623.1 VWA domain-containing protein [Deinococcus sp. ZS9-10]